MDQNTSKFEYQCSGTILNAQIIVSAMSCFWDAVNGTPFNVSLFKVKVGKEYKEYGDGRETLGVQSISIKNITKPEAWEGSKNGFLGDIAILLLDDYIVFKTHVAPVCVDYDLKYVNDDHRIEFGLVGSWRQFGNRILLDFLYNIRNTTELVRADRFCIR